MPIHVRPARLDEVGEVSALCNEVQRLHVDLYPDEFHAELNGVEVEAFFGGLIAQPQHHVIVTEVAAVLAGYLWFEVIPRRENPFRPLRTRITIHHIGVQPSQRRRGVGQTLMAYLDEFALAKGVDEITLDTWSGNNDAHLFFEAAGFQFQRRLYSKRF